jgi:uncharacterized protein involved in high-affinity Fe2+ transport
MRWAGPLITLAIIASVGAVLLFNLEPRKPSSNVRVTIGRAPELPVPTTVQGGFREYPIGEAERNHMQIAAVWLPSVHMDGMPAGVDSDVIHLEADVKATEGNPNGFAAGEFVPYLTIRYNITPTAGGPPIEGPLMPMVARDGLHYGASVSLPGRGNYRLTYAIEPPSSGGLGRHDDPQTGVAPWWAPFEVSFDWKFDGVPRDGKK